MSNSAQTFSHYPAIHSRYALPLISLPAHPCNYLPDRTAQMRGFLAANMPANVYHDLMDAGFRRDGRFIYQPICGRCRACVPIRVDVAGFKPDKSQRRCRRRNADLKVSIAAPVADDESFDLYSRYLRDWHERPAEEIRDREGFERSLHDSPARSIEFRYRDSSDRLLAVGLCDVSDRSLSSVYFYFDPAHSKRSLGTFGALCELAHAREIGVPHYYLGYWIRECRSMTYKSSFRPFELLDTDGIWRSESRASAARSEKSFAPPVAT